MNEAALRALASRLKAQALGMGFSQVGIGSARVHADEAHLMNWLGRHFEGEMAWMARHPQRRARPDTLVPGTLRVISVALNYWPKAAADADGVLSDPSRAYIARYALGRDYHRIMRPRLAALGDWLNKALEATPPSSEGHQYRAFVDSGPLLERALAREAGLGFIGKHTCLIHPDEGSWFLLGELLTNLPLPVDPPYAGEHCGRCSACIDVCPTGAIVAPYQLDARRCISYLTIEFDGVIPVALRRPIGNRIFGCDDCQLVCPWNRHAVGAMERDLAPRHGLDAPSLESLWEWDEATYLARTEGSPLRRMGYRGFRRNLAVALGNAIFSLEAGTPDDAGARELRARLAAALGGADELVAEHIAWALGTG